MAACTSTMSFVLRSSAALLILDSSACSCLKFGYPTFDAANMADFSFSPGSGIGNGSLQITPNTGDIRYRSGRVCYARETLKLWNSKRPAPVSFSTEFVLNILPHTGRAAGGMAFILTNNPALPENSSGRWLGITNNQTNGARKNRIVAVEFDSFNSSEGDLGGTHVGIDINSIKSTYGYPLSNLSMDLSSGFDVWVGIKYDGAFGGVLSIAAYQQGNKFEYSRSIDLSRYLLDNITVGFAASTGSFTQLNQVKSWNFSMLGDTDTTDRKQGHRTKLKLLLALLIPLTIALSFLVFGIWRRLTRQRSLAYRNLEKRIDAHGLIRFKLRELRDASANFSPARKLGQGGFGTVYLGYMHRMGMEVAVKRVSASGGSSSRGEQEFVAEVNTIGKLSHRNLVKLIGWCHERGELLLVYEYFSKGSLDKLLYAGERSASASTTLLASTPCPSCLPGNGSTGSFAAVGVQAQ